MLRDQAVSRIQRRLGFRTASFKVQDIFDELQNAQDELEEEFLKSPPWFLLTEMAEATTTASEERLPLPSNFAAEYEEGFVYVYDSTKTDPWAELTKWFYGQLKAEYITEAQPVRYAIVGKDITLHPTPDAVYTIKMRYYKTDTDISLDETDTTFTNDWLTYAGRVIMNRAGMNMAESMKDRASSKFFENSFVVALKSVKDEIQARKMRNLNLVRSDI